MSMILKGEMPVGQPAEPMAQEHLDALAEILQRTDDEGFPLQQTLESFHAQLLQAWMAGVQQKAQMEAQEAAQMQAAADLQNTLQGQQAGGGPPQPGGPMGSGMVGPGDVADESLPASGTPQG
jgi:hypothetical protein